MDDPSGLGGGGWEPLSGLCFEWWWVNKPSCLCFEQGKGGAGLKSPSIVSKHETEVVVGG